MSGWGRNYGRIRTCGSRRRVGPADSRATVTCTRLHGHRDEHFGRVNLWIRGEGVERDSDGDLLWRAYRWADGGGEVAEVES